ncbi:dihydroorotase [Candidatus Woesearchaeota archaeon]|nr:dihydroorotase [Candidatus Woesearchaeota archaeon]
MNTILKNGQVYNSKKNRFAFLDLAIKDGRIAQIKKGIRAGQHDLIVDCKGKHIIPGLIDAHVHFREPGDEQKEDFLSGSRAAAAGGVTTVLDMPNTNPPVVSGRVLAQKRELAGKSLVNYGFYVLGCAENADQLSLFKNIAGIKVYLGSSTGNYGVDDLGVFAQILEYTPGLVVVHAECGHLLRYFAKKYEMIGMHHRMRPNVCAQVSVADACILASSFKKRLHIAHMSTKEEVAFLKMHKTPQITCEVSPHHLFLNESFFRKQGNFGKMNPPLRYEEDRKALWQAIKEGLVDLIATDHAPHTKEEKEQDFRDAPCGVPGVQTMLPLLLNAVHEKKLSLADVVRLCSENPAQVFGIEKRGQLSVGYHADICVVDLKKKGTIRNEEQQSKCSWTPFHGWKCTGWPVMTMVNGNVVYRNGAIDESAKGVEVRFRDLLS